MQSRRRRPRQHLQLQKQTTSEPREFASLVTRHSIWCGGQWHRHRRTTRRLPHRRCEARPAHFWVTLPALSSFQAPQIPDVAQRFPAASAPTVARQLESAAVANAPAPKPQAPVVRGMGARGIGRGSMGAKGAPPPNLLTVGMVPRATPAAPAAAPTNTAKAPEDAEAVATVAAAADAPAKPAARRKKAGAAKKAPRKKETVSPAAAPVASCPAAPCS